ncbi:hypothetical protein GCM10011529_11380 [Polymorphobacter glacialis]|uniref:Tetratricopeptide repeat protein n=1 Tax=Sandarakinorhabdus glacialis TaxID=1614636 RepID=A0A916ZNT3_9SPHN|nr:hypothetical protein [Polymorphobacter glacialis]GGE06710.1 hypothetical protein GCM10011529_11380 [Polymorphobacter glacialis]
MKIFARSFAAALLATATLTAGPAMAQKKQEAPKPPKLTKGVQAALAAAQALQTAGDSAGALAKVAEAEAVPSPTADDTYMINAVRLNSAVPLKDNALIEKALTNMLATGKVKAEDQTKFLRTVGSLAMERKDYAAATTAFETLVKTDASDPENVVALSELYWAQKQTAKAVDSLNQAITASKTAGKVPPESWYRRRLAIAYDGKLAAQVQPAALGLVEAYPNAVNWRDAIIITRDSFPSTDEQVALDFMRLQSATGSLNGERDFVEYADTALGRGFPGEADTAIREGIQRNMLSATKPLVKELQTSAQAKSKTDKASLPGLEKEIKGNPKIAISTGDAYYGYADYAKAASLYRQAAALPGVDAATANLRLGMALARSGDKAGATAALTQVTGGPREALAKYWLVHLNKTA